MDTAVPTFQREGLDFHEVTKQEYKDGFVAAGFVAGHPEDSVYIHFDRPALTTPTIILLRPDELAALLMCGSGVLWSIELGSHIQSIGEQP